MTELTGHSCHVDDYLAIQWFIEHFKGSEWMLRQLLTTGPPNWFRDDGLSVTYDQTTGMVTMTDARSRRRFPFILTEWLKMEHREWVAEIKKLPSFSTATVERVYGD